MTVFKHDMTALQHP